MLSPSSASLLLLAILPTSLLASSPSPLGKRASLFSRQRECLDPGWIPACPNAISPCLPPGGSCCSDNEHYALPPLIVCPAGSTPIAPSLSSAPSTPVITPAPSTPPPSPSTIVEYTWYTWTFTYYYYYYFYTFINAYERTSTRTTYFTTVSFSATDEVQASAAFTSLSAALETEVPSQTVTPTVGSTPVETPTETEVPTPTETPVETPSVSSVGYSLPPVETLTSETSTGTAVTVSSYPTGNGTLPSTAVPVPSEFPGAGARAYGTAGWAVLVGGLGLVVPGVMMVWL